MRPRLRVNLIRFFLFIIFIGTCIFIIREKNRNELRLNSVNTVYDSDGNIVEDYVSDPVTTTYAQDNCPEYNDDMTNVHFILHSHDDPGWLKTAQTYYDEDVKHILDNIYIQLNKDENRRAVYSEMYYFNKWWSEISSEKRETVKFLVSSGQLEFVGGGWVQNDDATTHYTANIDQLGHGLRTIKNIFGPKARPVTGWQIDCFGYSKEQASIFAQTGYISEVIHRIPDFDRARRRANGQMEFMWQGDQKNKIFTHVLYDEYIPPTGLKFENYFTNVQDKVTRENVGRKMAELINTVEERIKSYPTNHLLMIMGNDFVFKDAAIWFDSVDRLIEYGNILQVNNGSKINFLYSNPSCYFKAVMKNVRIDKLPIKFGDFFPYTSNEQSYWTGYYSTRPTLKRLIRNTNNLLQTLEKFEFFVSTKQSQEILDEIRDNFFLTLHHDAITGTCKQHVADDYTERLLGALKKGQKLASHIIATLSILESTDYSYCQKIEINSCTLTQSKSLFALTVFNGHSKSRIEFIRIPVNFTDIVATNGKFPIQFVTVSDGITQFSVNHERAKYEMIVRLNLPALSYTSYHFERQKRTEPKESVSFSDLQLDKNYIENKYYKIIFDSKAGYMSKIVNKEEKISTNINQTYIGYYNDQSGAYMLRINDYAQIPFDGTVTIKRRDGAFFQEMQQVFDKDVTQIVRLYENKKYVEIEWTAGPLTTDKELVTRFNVDIFNLNTSYTDANGRQLIERNTEYPQNESTASYPTATKYYPTTCMISIKDNNTQLTLIPDRPTGGSTTKNGSLEIMLHRRLAYDDGAGLGEGIREEEYETPIVVRGKFWLTLTLPGAETDKLWRDLAKEMFYNPIVMFSDLDKGPQRVFHQWSMANETALNGVHILSIQRLDDNSVLIRFENYLNDVQRKFSIKEVFVHKRFKRCRETVLTGDKEKIPNSRYANIITLDPLEIKTFVCVSINSPISKS